MKRNTLALKLLFSLVLIACNLSTVPFSTATPTASLTNTPPAPTETPLPTQTPKPAFELLETRDTAGVSMMFVPEGVFKLGDSNLQSDDNQPIHEVNIPAYYIDKYEVTNAQYQACVNAGVCRPPEYSSFFEQAEVYFGNPIYDSYPVVFVNWYDAQTFCQWRGARLPSEAEWEKAARGDTRLYPWGSTFSPSAVNGCDKNCPRWDVKLDRDDGYAFTAPVGSFSNGLSPYGLEDMAGNVSEWTSSLLINYPYNPTDGREDTQSQDNRVIRGGSWESPTDYSLRSANRGWATPIGGYDSVGFRCARNPNP
ncbi:MAG: formylglycine-generating enzyme family protein [Anaerolineales bacterium]|nr:formylglycine-generating enzyme family protein [Anaerolineales bacterium]